MEREARFFAAIAKRVEALECPYRCVEHAFATLPFNVGAPIARQGCNNLNLLTGEKFCEVLLAAHFQNREIAAIDDVHAHVARGDHEMAEIRIQFGSAPGDVEDCNAPLIEKGENEIGDLVPHLLAAVRPGIHMAMHARLIAAIAHVELQRVEPPPADRGEGNFLKQWPSVAHRKTL